MASLTFAEWGRPEFSRIVESAFHFWPENSDDTDALHELRIQLKRLRYATELLGCILPKSPKKHAYPLLRDVQESLGTINDHQVATKKLERWIRNSDSADESQQLEELYKVEQVKLDEAIRDFDKNWNRASKARFQRALKDCLGE